LNVDHAGNGGSLYGVMTAEKSALINLRVAVELRREIKVAARLMGFKSVTGALHHYIVKVIREQKEAHPQEFARMLAALEEEDREKRPDDKKPPTGGLSKAAGKGR
jgi:hypothetical protein